MGIAFFGDGLEVSDRVVVDFLQLVEVADFFDGFMFNFAVDAVALDEGEEDSSVFAFTFFEENGKHPLR